MNNIKKILCFLLCLTIVNIASASNQAISLETKVFGSDVVFVFYHDKNQIIDLTQKGGVVYANINVPSEFNLTTAEIFNQYATGLNISNKKQSISFKVKDGLEYNSVINGEKLDAIKFRLKKKKTELEDLSTLSSANNDPGAVKYDRKGDNHHLNFNLGGPDTSAAMFFRGKYLWIIFDQKKVFSFEDAGIFGGFETVPSSEGTVVRVRVDEGYSDAKLTKIHAGWVVTLSKKSNNKIDHKNVFKISPLDSPEEDGALIHGDFAKNSLISFHDPEIGDMLSVMPVRNLGMRVVDEKKSDEFSILNSVQGVAIAVYNDDVKIEKTDKEIKVLSDASLPDEVPNDVYLFPAAIDEYLKLPTILPYLDNNLDILDFNQQKSKLISEAAQGKDADEQFDKNLDLARFYFIHGWYQESLDAVLVAKSLSDENYQKNLQARFLTAVNYTMVGDNGPAKEEYDALLKYEDISKIAEINLWNKNNEFSLGANPGSIGFSANLSKTINYYSDDKYWPMLFAEIELTLLANDLKTVEKLLRDHKGPAFGSKYANSLKFYQAEYYRKKEQSNLAKQFYREVVANDTDLFNATRAEFNLVKLRVKEQDMLVSDAINSLEALRFGWRGDQLEYEILMQLASYYRDNNDIMNALRTYQYIQTAFNNKISNFYITSEMARIFNEVFLAGGLGEKMDDFTVVALFYEFKELNPIGAQGDDVIIGIAKRLVRLDLLENASGLLRHQIKFRLQGEKRITNADNLAIVLLMDKKPHEAMLVLDDTDRENFNFKEHQYRTRLRARAMIDLENYSDAILYLKDDDTPDAEILRREALFQGKNWNGYIDRINNDFDQIIEKLDNNNSPEAQDILRVSICYYMLNQQEQLTKLMGLIGSKNQALKDTIELLITSSEPIDYKNLDKSLSIDQMKTLLDKYKNKFLGE